MKTPEQITAETMNMIHLAVELDADQATVIRGYVLAAIEIDRAQRGIS